MQPERGLGQNKGLGGCKGCCKGPKLWKAGRYFLDYSSGPDDWKIGFEIVYRIVFYTTSGETLDTFRRAFKEVFGLPDDHYLLEEPVYVGSSNFWRTYWDKGWLDLGLLKKCERRLDAVARRANTAIIFMHRQYSLGQ